jgi:hypothetical protein
MRAWWIALLGTTAVVPTVKLYAQDIVADVEYFTGKDGFADKKKGVLVLSAEGVKFAEKDGGKIFDIPRSNVRPTFGIPVSGRSSSLAAWPGAANRNS